MPGPVPGIHVLDRGTRLVHLLVRVGAPKPFLPDITLKAFAAELAPVAVAGLQRAEHTGLQTGRYR